MNSKGSLVVQNSVQITFNRIQDIFTFSKQICQLPSIFYIILLFYWLCQSTFPLLLTDLDDVWNDSPYLKNLIQFFQIFWRFSSNCTKDTDILISFIVMIAVPLLCLIPFVCGYIKFVRGHTFSQTLAYIICLTFEVFLVFFHSWFPSEIATLISILSKKESKFTSYHFYFLIILILFCLLYYLTFHYIVSGESPYSSTRVIFWDSKSQMISILFFDSILFFTRLVETLPKTASIVFTFVTIAICVLRILHCIFYFPFTIMICNPFSTTITFSFLIAFILLSISHFIVHIHIIIVLIVLVAVTIISDIVIKIIWTKIIDKYLCMNEYLISEQYELFDLVKSVRQFLLLVRFGFINGHPYVFTWRPFKQALQEWPNNKEILCQYMKFVAIYTQENQLLSDLLTETKSIKDYAFKNFRKQIKVIKESRISFYSPKLKRSLKDIDDDIKTVKNYIVSYWNAVKDNSFNVSFDIGKHLNEKISFCHLNYIHLISLYPNNTIILSNYAKFLQNIMCNPKESQYWLQRKEYLSNKNNYVFDLTQSVAFKMFPAIPHALKNLSVRNDENSSVQSILSDSKTSMQSQLTDMTEKTAFKTYESNEEIDITASSIYEHGKKAPIPLLRILFFLSFLLFFLSCGLGFSLPIAITGVNQNKIKNLFVSVKTISEISNSFSALSYFFLFKSMIAVNILPSHEQMINIMIYPLENHHHLEVDQHIRDVLINLHDNIHIFQRIYGHEVPINSYTSHLIRNSMIDFVSLNKTSPIDENITFTMDIFQALNFLCSYLFKYAEAEVTNDLLHDDWMMIIHLNSLKIPTEMVNLMTYASHDIILTIVSTSETICKIFVVITICNIIILPFFIYLTLRIRHQWNYIMKTINSLPRVAIQKVITRNSKEEEEDKNQDNSNIADEQDKNEDKKNKRKQTKRAELKYQNLFLQMTSSRDTSSGVPITQILFLAIFSIIISVASFILVFIIHKSLENKLRSMPICYYLPNLVSTINYAASTLFLRRILLSKNESLFGDTIERSVRAFTEIEHAFTEYLNLLLFGQYNSTNIGTISSESKGLNNLMYDINGDWITKQPLFFNLMALPHYFALEILFDKYATYSNDAKNPQYVIDPNDVEFLTYIHYATEHLPIEFIYQISEDSSSQFYLSFQTTFITIVFFEIVIFLVNSISFCLLLYQLYSVYRTIRFSLSALSMIDYEYFQDLTNIIDLFSGASSSNSDGAKALNNSMTEMIDVINEAVIEINEEFLVIDANDEMLDWLSLKMYQLKGSRLTNHISFADSKIEKSILSVLNDPKKEEIIEMSSEITIVGRNITEKRSFEVIHLRNENQNAVIIVFKTSHDLSSMRQKISQLKSQIEELTIYAIPVQLRHKEYLRSQSHAYNAHFISVTAIEIMNLNEFSLNHTPSETCLFYNTFINKIDEFCETGDKIKFNKSGRFIYVAFNLVKQTPNYYSGVNESISFIYDVNDYAIENGYKVRYSSLLLKSALANLNGMEFTLYSSKIQHIKNLMKYSKESCLTYSSKFHDLLPRKMTKDSIQIKIPAYDNISDKQSWAFCLKLTDKSLR